MKHSLPGFTETEINHLWRLNTNHATAARRRLTAGMLLLQQRVAYKLDTRPSRLRITVQNVSSNQLCLVYKLLYHFGGN